MLRIFDSTELDGYVFKSPGGPQCELFGGHIADIKKEEDAYIVTLSAKEFENGTYIERFVKIYFMDRGANRKMCATRLIASRAHKGAYITVLTMYRNDKRIALEFRYEGLWRLNGYHGEKNVLLGKIRDIKETEETYQICFLEQKHEQSAAFKRKVRFTGKEIIPYARKFLDTNDIFALCICSEEKKRDGISEYDCIAFEVI